MIGYGSFVVMRDKMHITAEGKTNKRYEKVKSQWEVLAVPGIDFLHGILEFVFIETRKIV